METLQHFLLTRHIESNFKCLSKVKEARYHELCKLYTWGLLSLEEEKELFELSPY